MYINIYLTKKYIGAFSRMALGADQFIGNYKGKIRKNLPQSANQEFVWPVNYLFSFFFKSYFMYN